ncbi:MAG: hypothetical protein KF688_10940 [Pirellulales bacterium]|nr:hypothetical protein [Pirellulales bacterium]
MSSQRLGLQRLIVSTNSRRLLAQAACLWCVVVGATPAATGQLINLNFTNAPYSGSGETSPATPAGPAGVWNNLTTGVLNDPGSFETDGVQVLLADGSPGPTLTLDASSGTSSGNSWNGTSFVSPISSVDYTTGGGVYDVPNLYESGVVNGGNNTTGFRLRGLAAGTYDVFVVPMFRNAQAAGEKADPAVSFRIGLGNDVDARNAGDYALLAMASSTPQFVATNLTTWVAATDGTTPYNYFSATVAIDGPNRWLTILLGDSATTGPDRAGLSVVQVRASGSAPIVAGDFDEDGDVDGRDFLIWQRSPAVGDLAAWRQHFGTSGPPAAVTATPEPASWSLALLAGLAGGCWRRKRSLRTPRDRAPLAG